MAEGYGKSSAAIVQNGVEKGDRFKLNRLRSGFLQQSMRV
jgi:hypothetical protein